MNSKLQIQMLPPQQLTPNPWNSNVVSPANEAKLEESIKRHGMFKPVIVREMEDGSLQIIGGQHRAQAAQRMGVENIPVVNLGRISEKKAKEVGLLDNGRYGSDNTLQLAELLEELGTPDELAVFMPFSETELTSIFSSVNISLDDLDIDGSDDDDDAVMPKSKPTQTHQVMRFKVPIDDVDDITDLIEKTMKQQKFTESDSLTNAGDALVFLLQQLKEEEE